MRIEEIPVRPKEPKITRVAAYARVSSDKDAAFHSLEAQTNTTRIILRRTRTGSWLPSTQTMGFPVRPSTARSSIACCRTAGRVRLIL